MAAERRRIVSFPGDNASSERVVTTPYATANRAQTTATRAPWFDRKLDKRKPRWTQTKRNGSPIGPPRSGRESNARVRLLPRDPEAPGPLRRAGLARLGRLGLRL